MDDELADWWVHTATIETLEGTDGYGVEHFAGSITLSPDDTYGCFIEQKRRLVRDKDGAEVVSETTVYAPAAIAALCTPGSRVTIGAEVAHIITTAVMDSGPLDLPDHVVIALDTAGPRGR